MLKEGQQGSALRRRRGLSPLLTSSEGAQILNVSLPRVYEPTRHGKVPAVRLGRQVGFSQSARRDFVKEDETVEPRAR